MLKCRIDNSAVKSDVSNLHLAQHLLDTSPQTRVLHYTNMSLSILCVTKKQKCSNLSVDEMRMLRWMNGNKQKDRIKMSEEVRSRIN